MTSISNGNKPPLPQQPVKTTSTTASNGNTKETAIGTPGNDFISLTGGNKDSVIISKGKNGDDQVTEISE